MTTVISIARLVPIYTSGMGAMTKPEAVRTVTSLRLSSRNSEGRGNRAKRRAASL